MKLLTPSGFPEKNIHLIGVDDSAQQICNDIPREADLNTCGYVLLRRNDIKEAITIFRINTNLFPQSPNCFDSLGEAYLIAGMKDKSKACYKHVLELDHNTPMLWLKWRSSTEIFIKSLYQF